MSTSTTATGRISPADGKWLAETLVLAAGKPIVHPDPLVGSVIVDGDRGRVVGRGWHAARGGTHAEPVALAEAGDRARGGTLYCNLEPCGYDAPEKRQPACTAQIVRAGIARVVIGQIDPHPRVRGSGVRALLKAGVRVDIASDPAPYWLVNPVFNSNQWLDRPFVYAATFAHRPQIGGIRVVFDVETSPEHIAEVPADAHSVLIRSGQPERLTLPVPWQVDAVDRTPSPRWIHALRSLDAGAR